jgi:excinuclease ABC subunit A
METRSIIVKGAREHNLRGVDLTLPKNKLICFTGVSGSGKSSFAFDTLYAEGQRRYVESLSAYARQFMGQLPKPDVDAITGLSPSISIQQQAGGWNPRSTVGTVTQIHDFLRVLYARVGTQHCPQCDQPITAQTREQIAGHILALPAGEPLILLAPVARGQKGEFRDLFDDMLRQGYARARVDGRIVRLSDDAQLDKNRRHDIEIVIDRIASGTSSRSRLVEAVDAALELGSGVLIVQYGEGSGAATSVKSSDLLLSSRYACTNCQKSFEPPSPQMFSFNSPTGMCTGCDGLGTRFDFDPDLLVVNPKLSLLTGAVEPIHTPIGRWRRHIFEGVARLVGFELKTPWKDLPPRAKKALLFGTGGAHVMFEWRSRGGTWRHGGTFEGIIAELRGKHKKARATMVRAYYEKYMRKSPCGECDGARLNPQARAVRVGGLRLQELTALPIDRAAAYFDGLALGPTERIIAEQVLKEIRGRLKFLTDVGLEYLTLDRSAPTLSGGESQRIRLASQIGAGLVGVLYILDEPSIGLHARDNAKLLASLLRLRDQGNTVIVVEHDEETMRSADLLVDFGPGPGVRGGEIVASGSVEKVVQSKKSLTGKYLSGQERIEVPPQRRPVNNHTTGSAAKANLATNANGLKSKSRRNAKIK